MTGKEKENYLRRWSYAIHRIGYVRLLSLPRPYRERLTKTTGLIGKTLILEELATWLHE